MKKSIVFFFTILLTVGFVTLAQGQTNVVPDDQEFQALKALYDSLGGSAWTTKTNWPAAGNWPATATASQMGTWYGITVTNGDVTTITLNPNNLTGKIPSIISNLKALKGLNLGNNKLSGSIPKSLGSLPSLNTIFFAYNQLSGPIPTELNNLSSLYSFNVMANKLSGDIPNLGGLTSLGVLSLRSNTFNAGPVPAWLGTLTTLQTIDLGGTNRNGTIPTNLGNLKSLTALDLSVNQLTGSIPNELTTLPLLGQLYLQTNALSGSIPTSIGNLTNLVSIYLSSNSLSGSIPPTLGNLTKLTTLVLTSNQLTGSIPSTLGNLTALTNLSLDGNQLSGSIPASLGNLSKVVTFTLASNNLTGGIPSELGKLAKVRYFYLYNNKLTGTLPSTMGNMTSLGYLHVGNNQLTGPLPNLSKLTALAQVIVNTNKMSGEILMSNFGTSVMVDFQIGGNQFSGTFPDMSAWPNISSLNIGGNNLTGAFPSIVNNPLLGYIYAAPNGFTSIPSSLINMKVRGYVNFENNAITTITNLQQDYAAGNLHPISTLSFWVDGNQLDFAQMETLSKLGISSLKIVPQNTITDVSKLSYTVNSPLVIQARPKGVNSTVTWQKQNTDGTWATVNASNNDATQQSFTHSAAPITDEGVYRWSMTNSVITGLTLSSCPITVTSTARNALNQWGFQYQYDGRRRMIGKRVPGADWVYMVYDDRDRLVLTQDANQRANNQWAFTKYDQLNRPILTGIRDTSLALTQAQMQAVVNAFYKKSGTTYSESFVGYTGTNVHGYTNTSYPIRTGTTSTEVDPTKYLTVTYYDNYAFLANDDIPTYQYVPGDAAAQTVGSVTYQQPATNNANVIGQVTGTKIKALDNNIYWLKSVNYYDDKYRVVQSIADHQRMGQQRTTNVYDFVGKVLASKSTTISQGPTWQNKTNVTVSGNQTTTGAQCCWAAGSSSVQQLAAGQDGWVEANVILKNSGNNNYVTFGLSQADVNVNYNSINYAWEQASQTAYVYENGVMKYQVATVPGDILRVERTGTTVKYKKNGVVLYTSTVASTTSLLYDNSLFYIGAILLNPKASFATSSNTVSRTFTYDHAGRLLQTWHSLNGATPVLLVANSYNELGQLVTKSLYKSGSTFKQNVNYAYNIRGWLTRINDSDLSSASNQAENGTSALPDLFGMNLLYEQADAGLNNMQQYNGNISAMKWSNNLSLTSTKSFAYNYGYDTMNRIKSAAYLTNPGVWTTSGKFAENGLKYDLNGNIKALARTDASGASMDALTYDYTSNGNQLRSVTDAGDINSGFFDGNITGDDYSYDANGNMTVDKNKNITAIAYNHLNLPNKVTKGTGESIVYTYDAGGRKLTQKVYSVYNVLTKTTDYLGEYIYQNDTLQFVNHEEGRIVTKGVATPEYQFHLKDHLGNVRTTFTTARNVDTPVATFETANQNLEQSQFLRYDDARTINSVLFDHTHIANPANTTMNAERLSGSANEKTGIARSISVMPGDTVNLSVYAKWVDPNNSNNTAALTQLLGQIVAGTAAAGTVIDGANYSVNGITPFPYAGLAGEGSSTGTGPKAFLNYLIFDRNFVFVNGGYVQMTTAGKEDGTNVPHQLLSAQVIITQPGYLYTYLSNEEPSPKEVYFDDFKVQQIKSPVVQQEDFYPFGLSFN
ncbi:MAG: hypothetical protein JSS79_08585, partial [Bacteroidetes bacterium]|nr:hypothetical protein [Bacteroidota bacterium]